MKTTLSADGQIGIPTEIRQADHLSPGDSFELERLTPGRYLLAKQSRPVGLWGPLVLPLTLETMAFRSSARPAG